jgi:hypothetical protein
MIFIDQDIGRFLLEVCHLDSEVWVVAEAIDTVMDVFGEDETDIVAADIKLVDKLRALLPSLKREVRLCFKYYSEWLNVKY